MTAKYFAILTNYGAAQLANAVALGTQMNISVMGVGDGGGTLPVPDPAQTTLIRENRRAAVNQVSVDDKNPNIIIAEQVIPENEGGWWIREIGLYDDNGGLIAVGNVPETYKPNLQEGSGRTQVLQMALIVSSTQAITLKVDPSVVLATREYVTKSIDAAIQASEARTAQTYQPKGDYVTNSYLKLELLKKIDKADITQQLGNDTGKVVSQHLLTTEVGKLQPKGDYAYKSDLSTKRDVTNTIFKTLSYQPYDTQLNSIWLFTNEENADWRQGIARNRDGITGYSNFRSDHSGDVAHTNELLGFYQQWQDVTKERQGGVVYNNNTGRPICVFVRTKKRETPHALGVGGTVQGIAVGGSWAGANGQEIELSCFFIVPPGHNYSADSFLGNSGNFIGYWSELR
ncbi:phage tail protein [Morganella morganii]|uniref:phage tail protein n=1 Tax=Morganella morganii TaxID=582 RepID=UPI003EB8F63D